MSAITWALLPGGTSTFEALRVSRVVKEPRVPNVTPARRPPLFHFKKSLSNFGYFILGPLTPAESGGFGFVRNSYFEKRTATRPLSDRTTVPWMCKASGRVLPTETGHSILTLIEVPEDRSWADVISTPWLLMFTVRPVPFISSPPGTA